MQNMRIVSGLVAVLCGALTGCATEGVGDPCRLENTPEAGFVREEVYIENNSVQCRTRVCLAYKLRGNPRHVIGEDTCPCVGGGIPMFTDAGVASCELVFNDCISPDETKKRMQCTCRCGLLPGDTSAAPLCDCPSGFVCEGEYSRGGPGSAGVYCIGENIRP
jgi:hypothetical protein